MNKIKIQVNGNEIEIEENSTVKGFIEERQVTGTMFVIEKNLQIVQKENYSTEQILEGDKIEIVSFFGGG